MKQSIADWVMARRPEAAAAEKLFCVGREVFRPVPPDRDYTCLPEGLRRHYDEWGQLQVKLGKYKHVITFADHFVPLVRQLPWLESGETSPETSLNRDGRDRQAAAASARVSAGETA